MRNQEDKKRHSYGIWEIKRDINCLTYFIRKIISEGWDKNRLYNYIKLVEYNLNIILIKLNIYIALLFAMTRSVVICVWKLNIQHSDKLILRCKKTPL